jgi:hypothetical protein
MAFIHHDRVPVFRSAAAHEIARRHAIDGGEYMIELRGHAAADDQLTEGVVTQHLAVGAQRLPENFFPMGDEQQPRAAACLRTTAPVVERGDHSLAGAGGRDHQIAKAPVIALVLQLIEHLLLVGLGLQVEEGGTGDDVITRFAFERFTKRRPVRGIGRIVGLEFAVFP